MNKKIYTLLQASTVIVAGFVLSCWSAFCLAETHNVEFGISALYLQPGDATPYGSIGYSFTSMTQDPESEQPLSTTTNVFKSYNDKLNHKFGFDVSLAYLFCHSDFMARLHWLHYNNRSRTGQRLNVSQFPSEVTGNGGGPTINLAHPAVIPYDGGFNLSANDAPSNDPDFILESSARFKNDTINLSVGRKVSVGALTLYFSGDLRYANLERRKFAKANYVEYGESDTDVRISTESRAKFRAPGVGFVLNASYPLTNYFSLCGKFNSDLLVGRAQYSFRSLEKTRLPGASQNNPHQDIVGEYSEAKSTRLIPNIGAGVRLNYIAPLSALNHGSALKVWVGYQFTTYLQTMGSLNSMGGFHWTNFTLHGPNAGLSIAF